MEPGVLMKNVAVWLQVCLSAMQQVIAAQNKREFVEGERWTGLNYIYSMTNRSFGTCNTDNKLYLYLRKVCLKAEKTK